MSTVRERDALAIHGDDDTPEQMQAVTDRGDLIVVGDALAEVVGRFLDVEVEWTRDVPHWKWNGTPVERIIDLRAALARWREVVR